MAGCTHRTLVAALIVWSAACGSHDPHPPSPTAPSTQAPAAVSAIISGVSPGSLGASNARQGITITGSNFVAGLTLSIAPASGGSTTVSGSDISNLTATSFQASIVAASAGTFTLQVTNPGAAASNAVSLQVTAAAKPAPTIASVSPSVIVASPTAQIITVHGTNFQIGLTLGFARGTGATSLVSGAQIANVTPTSFDATIPLTGGGNYTFTVINPDTSVSNALVMSVDAPPAAPSAVLFSLAPDPIIARPSPQTISVSGQGFLSGLTLAVTLQNGASVTVSGSQITRVASQSFDAMVTIPIAGTYSFQVTNPGATTSNAITKNIQGAGSAACAAAAAPPSVGNINGLPVPQVVFAESATGVGFYATIYEDRTPSQLCGGGLLGPCPYVDACVVGGSCQGPVQILCGCISGGLEAHFTRTAAAGSCSATLTVHDNCGVSGTTTLNFALPPVSLPSTTVTDVWSPSAGPVVSALPLTPVDALLRLFTVPPRAVQHGHR